MGLVSKRIVHSATSTLLGLALSIIGIVVINYLPLSQPSTDVLFIPVAAAAGVVAGLVTRARDYWPLMFLAVFWGLVLVMGFLFPLSEGRMDIAARSLIVTGGSWIAVVASFLLVSVARLRGQGT